MFADAAQFQPQRIGLVSPRSPRHKSRNPPRSNLPLAFAGTLCYVGFFAIEVRFCAPDIGDWLGPNIWLAVVAELVDALP
jgi:hypothetical protein